MELSKSLVAELFNIGNNMPVPAGNLQSHQDAKELMDLGLAMRYEGQYVLTEKGKDELKRRKIESATRIANSSAFINGQKK